MAISRALRRTVLAVLMLELLGTTESRHSAVADDLTPVAEENYLPVAWRYRDNAMPLVRRKKNAEPLSNDVPQRTSSDNKHPIEDPKCRDNLRRLCGDPDNNNDHLFVLECVQTFKVLTRLHIQFNNLPDEKTDVNFNDSSTALTIVYKATSPMYQNSRQDLFIYLFCLLCIVLFIKLFCAF